ncbi:MULTISPECIES: hypothetical protein [unclassified Gordonia (in: high G+C Gram-positive bacteria)]
MTVITESRITGVMRAAEALLSQRAGSAVILADPEDLGGSGRTSVIRVRVAQNPLSLDRTLVIKALPDHEDPRAFHREIVSYKYATALPNSSRPGPQLIASDADTRLMVLSDLGRGTTMTALLGGVDVVEISRAVSAWGQALGRMHAATFGGEGDFRALERRVAAGGTAGRDILRDEAVRAVARAAERVDALGIRVPDVITSSLTDACALFDEGEHRAFSPSDVGPENILLNDDGVQFMDYEWGGFRDATLDIAYALVTAASQMGRTGAQHRLDLEVSMVDAWRSEVVSVWPALQRDRVMQRDVLTARLLWVWLCTSWMLPAAAPDAIDFDVIDEVPAPQHTHDWALHTNDPRVLVDRWSDLAATAAGTDHEIAAFATEVGAALQRTWLD